MENRKTFEYLKENLKGISEDYSNDTDHYIDFVNGKSFYIDEINDLYNEYNKIESELDNYIESNDLDNVNDCEDICNHFQKYKNYIQQFGQAVILDFENFALKKVQEIGDKKVIINYNTGAGNETAPTLEEAKQIADNGSRFTMRDITIEDGDGNVIIRRKWYGINIDDQEEFDIDIDSVIRFGTNGFYGSWEE